MIINIFNDELNMKSKVVIYTVNACLPNQDLVDRGAVIIEK